MLVCLGHIRQLPSPLTIYCGFNKEDISHKPWTEVAGANVCASVSRSEKATLTRIIEPWMVALELCSCRKHNSVQYSGWGSY